jgi:hypothetical protein
MRLSQPHLFKLFRKARPARLVARLRRVDCHPHKKDAAQSAASFQTLPKARPARLVARLRRVTTIIQPPAGLAVSKNQLNASLTLSKKLLSPLFGFGLKFSLLFIFSNTSFSSAVICCGVQTFTCISWSPLP